MASKRRSNGQGSTKPVHRPATLDHLQSKKAFRVFHPVVLDNEAAIALEEATRAFDAAKATYEAARARHLNYPANLEAKAAYEEAAVVLAEASEAHEEAREAAAEATVTMVLKYPGEHVIDVIERAHPPTEEDKAKWGAMDDFPEAKWPKTSPITYPPALIAACLIEPEMTEEQVLSKIWNNPDWNDAEKMGLLAAAYQTNNRAVVSLGKPSGGIRPAEPSRASATPTASPAPSSSDG